MHNLRISGHGFVQDNGSLRIGHWTVHSFGVYVPRQAQ